MAGKRAREKLDRTVRRLQVAELYYRLRLRQQEIADRIGCNQSTISRDIKALDKQWLKRIAGKVDVIRGRELGDLDEMERDCAIQFQTSKDPRWISERLKIKERRAKLIGLDVPERHELSGPDGGPIPVQTLAEWKATRAERLAQVATLDDSGTNNG